MWPNIIERLRIWVLQLPINYAASPRLDAVIRQALGAKEDRKIKLRFRQCPITQDSVKQPVRPSSGRQRHRRRLPALSGSSSGAHGRTPLGLWGWDSSATYTEKTKRRMREVLRCLPHESEAHSQTFYHFQSGPDISG